MTKLLLTFFILFIISFLTKLIIALLKKKELKLKDFYPSLFNGFITLLFSILLILIVENLFTSLSSKSYVSLEISLFLSIIFLNPYKYIFNNKNKITDKRKFLCQIIPFLLVFLEIFSFNYKSYKSLNNNQQITYTYQELINFKNNGSLIETEESLYMRNNSYIYIDFKEVSSFDNVYLEFNDINLDSYINFYIKYENSNDYTFYKEYNTNPKYDRFNIFSLPNSKYDSIKIVFKQDDTHNVDGQLKLKSISFNYPIFFDYHISRVIVLFTLISGIIYLPIFIEKIRFKDFNATKKIKVVILSLSALSLIVFLIYAFTHQELYFLKYPFSGDLKDYNIYMKLFDALKKGQVYLDVQPDQALIDLINPYDPSQRQGISYLWDHAYFEGKYYCYYGIAPLLLITFPIYWLTGLVADVLFLQIIAVILIVPTLLITIIEFINFFVKKINIPLLIFTLISSIFISLSLLNVTFKEGGFDEGIYHIPEAYGVLFSLLFILLLLRGYKDEKHRFLYFIGCGFSFGFLMASRPNMVYILLFTAPIFLSILFRKNCSLKRKALEFLPMFCVLIILGSLICYYNYARFKNIFEFGQFYQLTVTDNTNLSIKIFDVIPTLIHFFLQPGSFSDTFPFISLSYFTLNYEGHSYISSVLGALTIPFFWLIILAPFCFYKKEKLLPKITLGLLVLTIFLIALTSYSFAGVCVRYMLDFFPLCVLVSSAVMFKFLENKRFNYQALKISIPIFLILIITSGFITFNLSFNRFDGILAGDLNGILMIFKDFFGSYNC